jgi:hypothetical protein
MVGNIFVSPVDKSIKHMSSMNPELLCLTDNLFEAKQFTFITRENVRSEKIFFVSISL